MGSGKIRYQTIGFGSVNIRKGKAAVYTTAAFIFEHRMLSPNSAVTSCELETGITISCKASQIGQSAAVQRIEHYEMAGYGTVRTYAKLLSEDDVSKLLRKKKPPARSINVEAKS